ncbi:hypothetical protein KTE90_10475 [Burkholderia multivorans]|uniref:hypothetical protein n=1 Tax=Burkholderia multivorans TaxID=87883 RepID=UPI001C217392|nr:hypothetical protein [Burkholderia multivorans]MBU9600484.1 hypothetical protein [Burkholderia multivorans]
MQKLSGPTHAADRLPDGSAEGPPASDAAAASPPIAVSPFAFGIGAIGAIDCTPPASRASCATCIRIGDCARRHRATRDRTGRDERDDPSIRVHVPLLQKSTRRRAAPVRRRSVAVYSRAARSARRMRCHPVFSLRRAAAVIHSSAGVT